MNMKNVKETLERYELKTAKTCGCCGLVYTFFAPAYECYQGLIYADCPCGNTFTVAPLKAVLQHP